MKGCGKTTTRFDNLINIIWSKNKILLFMFAEIFTKWIGRDKSSNSWRLLFVCLKDAANLCLLFKCKSI